SGWKETPASGMRAAAFVIPDGDGNAEVTAISLAGAGGALLPNINRWRGQIQLGEINADELATLLKKINVDSRTAAYVELMGPEKAILGAIVPDGDQTWYFKLTGSVQLAEREKQNFATFVQSVRFNKAGAAGTSP